MTSKVLFESTGPLSLEDVLGTKFIFVTGGVVSSVGKGILAASLGRLLKSSGLKVSIMKLDPYLNPDPGTMSPYEHGEVFVTYDGAETDLDLGHYERFLEQKMGEGNSRSAGRIIQELLQAERRGDFAGQTIQMIPHFTAAIQQSILRAALGSQITLVEVGGTVGDMEAQPFLSAVQQLQHRLPSKSSVHVHVTWLLQIPPSRLQKTKPTQHSLKELRSVGISPDFIFCRSEGAMDEAVGEKLENSCGLSRKAIFSIPNLGSVYQLPYFLEKQGVLQRFEKALELKLEATPPQEDWVEVVAARELRALSSKPLRIALVAKYAQDMDSYRSIEEALLNSGYACGVRVEVVGVDAPALEAQNSEAWQRLKFAHGILVPGGFGFRGVEGKILAARVAREHQIPYFGICLGMQVGLIELARSLLGEAQANSTEFDVDTPYPIIDWVRKFEDRTGEMVYRSGLEGLGGTLRLGEQRCHLVEGSKVQLAYGEPATDERHRHRYEVNENLFRPLESFGVKVSGRSSDLKLIECIELEGHPWWVGCQYHPEFSATVRKGHPLFNAFLEASKARRLEEGG